MSAGNFVRSRYQCSEDSRIYSIRVQPETLEFTAGGTANSGSTEAISGTGSVRVGGSKRIIGIRARGVRFVFTGDDVPDDYAENQSYSLPVLTTAAWTAYTKGATGTYLNLPIEVISRYQESVV